MVRRVGEYQELLSEKRECPDVWSRLYSLTPVTCGVVATMLTLVTFVTYYGLKFGLNHPPSATGDEPEYDNLSWELAHGRGFRVDYSNPEFRAPYEAAAESSELYRLPTSTRIRPVTNRPPLYPFVMSLANRLLGRQFVGIRTIDALSMAVICGMLVTMVLRTAATSHLGAAGELGGNDHVDHSPATSRQDRDPWQPLGFAIAAMTALLFVAVDTRTRLYGRAILTEAMAAVEVAILCVLLFRFADRPTIWRAAGIGALLAIALLTRTQFILWMPGLILTMAWLAVRQQPRAVTDADSPATSVGLWKQAVLLPGISVLVMLLLSSPWMMRNCVVLGKFMPLGSQGWVQLSAAFSDSVWKYNGLWTNLDSEGFYDEVVTPEMSPIEVDLAKADHSRRRAMEWIAAHPGKAMALVPIKLVQEFRPRTIPEAIVLVLSIAGAGLAWRDRRARIFLAVVATCCVSIAVTWSVEGRFIVPLLFAQHGFIGLGLVRLGETLTRRVR